MNMPLMNTACHLSDDPLFAPTYAVARERFLERARRAGAEVERHLHPEVCGPAAEVLSIDVALLGVDAAESVLVVVSGTHGVEGFAGSAMQCALLDRLSEVAPGCGVMLVHALNPYGFAWLRRVNEANVDLNRNFLRDHADPPPDSGYAALHALVLPQAWSGPEREAADAAWAARIAAEGLGAVQKALTTGQYRFADGLYYGGSAPAWSNRVLRGLIEARLVGKKRVAVIDLHTGLGPSGHGEILFSGAPEGAECARAQAWYGRAEVAIEQLGDAISPPLTGEMPTAFDAVADASGELTRITLEFGTAPVAEVMEALRAEQWLNLHGRPHSPDGRAIKQALRWAFEVPTPTWRAQVLARSKQVIERAMAGLGS